MAYFMTYSHLFYPGRVIHSLMSPDSFTYLAAVFLLEQELSKTLGKYSKPSSSEWHHGVVKRGQHFLTITMLRSYKKSVEKVKTSIRIYSSRSVLLNRACVPRSQCHQLFREYSYKICSSYLPFYLYFYVY